MTNSQAPTAADSGARSALARIGAVAAAPALIALLTATIGLVGQDGGRPYTSMTVPLVIGAVAALAAAPLLLRWPCSRLLALLGWFLVPLLALAFAEVRAGWVRPVTAWTMAGTTFVAVRVLLTRPWGRTTVVAVAGLSLLTAWWYALLPWWAGSTTRGEPAWMALSWHNQSGTLMGVLGVGATAGALTWWQGRRTADRRDRLIADSPAIGFLLALVAAMGLAATWASGSRGAVAAGALGAGVVLVGAYRRPYRRTTSVVLLAILALTTLTGWALTLLWGAANAGGDTTLTESPLAGREQAAAGNLLARFGHWQAAIRMFLAHPFTGTGPGSYRWSSMPHYPADANLTSSAHSEQLEALAELGLLGGGLAVGLTIGGALLVLRALWSPTMTWTALLPAGALTVLLSHAAIDFDWDYPLLLNLTAVSLALLVANGRPPTASGPGNTTGGTTCSAVLVTLATVGAMALASGIAAWGAQQESASAPAWSLMGRLSETAMLAGEDVDAATEQLSELARWNPGAPGLAETRVLVAHAAGTVTAPGLRDAIDAAGTPHEQQLLAARQLLDAGHPDLADQVLTQLRPWLDERRAWGVRTGVAATTDLSLRSAHESGGCPAVRERAGELLEWSTGHGVTRQQLAGSEAWGRCLADRSR